MAGLDEAVADQDADRFACRAQADVVARRDLAMPGELVPRLQRARLDLQAQVTGDHHRQRDTLASARKRQSFPFSYSGRPGSLPFRTVRFRGGT
jgi:hypothetical protein